MPLPKRAIAASFLPDQYRYWYSLSKLAMDPLYEAVPGAFDDETSRCWIWDAELACYCTVCERAAARCRMSAWIPMP